MSGGDISYPILGTIAWIHEGHNYCLFSNQPTVSCGAPGIVYDRLDQKYICKYQITVGEHEIKLDVVYDQVKLFWEWLVNISEINPPQIKEYTWGKPTIICAQLIESKFL
ncbi:hypothetical protein K8S19_04665 [bacterium]|nr:hypothetical protein [bacterium]